MTVLIAVCGASPGIGKSTLCAGLSQWLARAGLRLDHFREEEIFTRPQFAALAEAFQATGAVGRSALLAATAQFADSVLARGIDVVVADALVPFVPSLLAMGHSDEAVSAFTADLGKALAPIRPVMVFLDGNAGIALSRAAAREGPPWLDWYIGKLARYEVNPEVHDAASAATYLQRERAVTLSVVTHHNWGLVVIENATELTPGEVLQAARQGLNPWIASMHSQASHEHDNAGRQSRAACAQNLASLPGSTQGPSSPGRSDQERCRRRRADDYGAKDRKVAS